jgi:hypothetical protein
VITEGGKQVPGVGPHKIVTDTHVTVPRASNESNRMAFSLEDSETASVDSHSTPIT